MLTTSVISAQFAPILSNDFAVRETIQRSRSNIVRSYELLWRAVESLVESANVRRISGASDAALVAGVLGDAPLCLPCIIRKTGVPSPAAESLLAVIGEAVQIIRAAAACVACLDVTATVRIGPGPVDGRSSSVAEPGTVPLRLQDVLWRFLESHRGDMFCTACLQAALGATTRLDRAMMSAEGRGARRAHTLCSSCGKDRLTCGLWKTRS
jgi:hypothetical protein